VSNEFPDRVLLTRREAAELSGTTLGAVNKAIEQQVLRPQRRGGRVLLAPEDVGALALLAGTRVVLPVTMKKQIAAWARSGPATNGELTLDGVLVVRIGPEVGEAVRQARRYVELRDQLVEVNPEVCGGVPVIKGTRVPVRSLARQIELGETLEVLHEDFWFMPEEAFELAPLWARTNPRQGRPSRPWTPSLPMSVSELRARTQAA
jgi:uncharacterized protein (DUF433 family)